MVQLPATPSPVFPALATKALDAHRSGETVTRQDRQAGPPNSLPMMTKRRLVLKDGFYWTGDSDVD
jgi:hypothetical protein